MGYRSYSRSTNSALITKVTYLGLFGNIARPIGPSFDGWKVTMRLSSQAHQEEAPCEASFGVSLGAKKDLDEFDVRKPRSVGSTMELFFDRPEWDPEYPRFASDIRAQAIGVEKWDFRVSNEPSTPSRLVFGGINGVPSPFEVYLIDEANGISADLASHQS